MRQVCRQVRQVGSDGSAGQCGGAGGLLGDLGGQGGVGGKSRAGKQVGGADKSSRVGGALGLGLRYVLVHCQYKCAVDPHSPVHFQTIVTAEFELGPNIGLETCLEIDLYGNASINLM